MPHNPPPLPVTINQLHRHITHLDGLVHHVDERAPGEQAVCVAEDVGLVQRRLVVRRGSLQLGGQA
jgi:hypothetical protein